MLAFDLDPGPPADVVDCCRVALRLRELFGHFGVESFPKTSGSKGMQVYVPLNRKDVSYEETKPFAKAIAQLLEKETPDRVVSKMKKVDRRGKVFVDWSQNHRSKTTVPVYSMRARERPTVSTPVTWDEVEHAAEQRRRRLTRLRDRRGAGADREARRPLRPGAGARTGPARSYSAAGQHHLGVVAGKDRRPESRRPRTFGGATLGVEVGGEGREAQVVEDVGVVGDVGADHELADPHRLVAGRCDRGC